jgi:hypothetical protein
MESVLELQVVGVLEPAPVERLSTFSISKCSYFSTVSIYNCPG